MYTLFHTPHSCSLAVKAALTICGDEFDIRKVNLDEGEQFSEAFKKINPLSKVPALKVGDRVLTEGAAILLFLAERYPDKNLMPHDLESRMEAYRWLQFMYSTLHYPYAMVFVPERYGNDAESIKVHAETKVHELFSIVNQQLELVPYIAGDALTLADLYLTTAINWEHVLNKSLTDTFPAVSAYKDRMLQHPVAGPVYLSELT